ncbi:putative MFS family arabinose efflux permease [Saccharopolyspora lacisalsi]|uniref:Putative MFS family arabinose efflux permease n=1 Tax=Halosaccharopolyspora lacisalsi TaxID=1000566 RepID=A0A839DXT3_9PSEU|nr:MFS transporter [Halosaccharopolyspora lacisalsi]MBA8824175.1 putative MFS family arabinose efflux permease [Halosaccharopolyspora lacisalsi]
MLNHRRGGGIGERTGGSLVHATGLAAVGLSLIAVCYGLARFAYGLFVPVLGAEFSLDSATTGAIASGSYGGYCVAIVLATVTTARWGPRVVAVAAGATATLGTGLVAAAPHAGVLAAGVVLAGSSTGMASPPLADAVARWVAADRAGRIQTVVNAGTGLGVMVSGPVALLFGHSWRTAWAAFALAAAVVTVWAARTIPTHRVRSGDDDSASGRAGTRLPSSWLPPGAPRLLIAAGVMGTASSAVWTFGREIVVHHGASPLASTLMWIALGAAGLLGALTGDLTAHTGLGRAWIAAMLTLAAATAGIALAAGSSPYVFVAAALFGVVYIALTGLLLLWGTHVYPAAPAFGVGAAFLLIAAGQALGSPLVGLLSDIHSPTSAFLTAAAAAALGAALRPRGSRSPRAPRKSSLRRRLRPVVRSTGRIHGFVQDMNRAALTMRGEETHPERRTARATDH